MRRLDIICADQINLFVSSSNQAHNSEDSIIQISHLICLQAATDGLSLQRFARDTFGIAREAGGPAASLRTQANSEMQQMMNDTYNVYISDDQPAVSDHAKGKCFLDALQEAYGNGSTLRPLLERLYLTSRPQIFSALYCPCMHARLLASMTLLQKNAGLHVIVVCPMQFPLILIHCAQRDRSLGLADPNCIDVLLTGGEGSGPKRCTAHSNADGDPDLCSVSRPGG